MAVRKDGSVGQGSAAAAVAARSREDARMRRRTGKTAMDHFNFWVGIVGNIAVGAAACLWMAMHP